VVDAVFGGSPNVRLALHEGVVAAGQGCATVQSVYALWRQPREELLVGEREQRLIPKALAALLQEGRHGLHVLFQRKAHHSFERLGLVDAPGSYEEQPVAGGLSSTRHYVNLRVVELRQAGPGDLDLSLAAQRRNDGADAGQLGGRRRAFDERQLQVIAERTVVQQDAPGDEREIDHQPRPHGLEDSGPRAEASVMSAK